MKLKGYELSYQDNDLTFNMKVNAKTEEEAKNKVIRFLEYWNIGLIQQLEVKPIYLCQKKELEFIEIKEGTIYEIKHEEEDKQVKSCYDCRKIDTDIDPEETGYFCSSKQKFVDPDKDGKDCGDFHILPCEECGIELKKCSCCGVLYCGNSECWDHKECSEEEE